MNENLKFTFSNINEWLKFAEAKVAGLLVLNSACIIGVLQANSAFNGNIKGFDGIIIILFSVSSCVCLYSILPVLNKWFRFYKKLGDSEFQRTKSSLNHLFFGDISKLSNDQYQDLFTLKYGITISPADKDLIHQITNNAEIALQKYVCFKAAGWISFAAFLSGVIMTIIKLTP